MNTELWPLIIIRSRYGGTYEGGEWIACTETISSLPEQITGSDIPCYDFFSMLEDSGYVLNKKMFPFVAHYGVGDSIEDAIKHLEEVKERYDGRHV